MEFKTLLSFLSFVSSSLEKEEAALEAASESDLAVLVIGIDHTIELETNDRATVASLGLQQEFLKRFSALETVDSCHGQWDSLAVDNLIEKSSTRIEAF
jgi:hypothetical protein